MPYPSSNGNIGEEAEDGRGPYTKSECALCVIVAEDIDGDFGVEVLDVGVIEIVRKNWPYAVGHNK
jgi:hypothetical protein